MAINAEAFSTCDLLQYNAERYVYNDIISREDRLSIGGRYGAIFEARQQEWRALASPANRAGPGLRGRGGLLQLAPRAHGLGAFEIKTGFELFPERASVAHFSGIMPGGVAWFNVYLKVAPRCCTRSTLKPAR